MSDRSESGRTLPPKVKIDSCSLGSSRYIYQGKRWEIATLLKAVKDQGCKPFDLPLAGIPMGYLPFQVRHVDDFIFQMERVNRTDLQYPIILDNFGYVADGWHRIVKAVIEGRRTIKAYRILDMPEHDSLDPDYEK